MQKIWVLGVVASVALTSIAQRSFAKENEKEKAAAPTTSSACIEDKSDPYDVGEIMHKGDYKGTCMDLSLHRPAVIVKEDDAQLTVANFYHAGHFYIAQVPKQGVDRIIFQIASFPDSIPGIKFAHTQLRFVLKEGVSVKLTPQSAGSNLPETSVTDFALVDQITAPKPLEDNYNPIKGLGPTYGNVIRIVDSNDRAHEELGGDHDTTRQFLLNLTDDEMNKILVNGIRQANDLGYNDIYKLFTENCTTVIFKVLDESDTYNKRIGRFKIHPWNILNPISAPSIAALQKRGIIEKELETWNEETGLK